MLMVIIIMIIIIIITIVNNSNNSESSRSQSQPNELNLLRELHSKVKGYLAINDYNIRSQTKWDENEAAFQADKHLLGKI